MPSDLDLGLGIGVDFDLSMDMSVELDVDMSDAPDDPEDARDTETVSKEELAKLRESFAFAGQARNFRDIERERNARNDSEYWFCLCFQSREQKEEFLRNSGLIADGDKYIDGQAAAAKLGIPITKSTSLPPGTCKVDKRLGAISRKE